MADPAAHRPQLYPGRVADALGFAAIFVGCAVPYPLVLVLVSVAGGKHNQSKR